MVRAANAVGAASMRGHISLREQPSNGVGASPSSRLDYEPEDERRRLSSALSDGDWLKIFMDGAGGQLFDDAWYLGQLDETLPDGITARDHFVQHGFWSGISPSPIVDAEHAAASVAPSARPLLRRLMEDRAGGSPHPLVDLGWYSQRYPDVAESGLGPFEHFVRIGIPENRSPHFLFDSYYYYRRHRDVARVGAPAILHFLKHGGFERREFHPLFDIEYYVAQFSEAEISGHNLLLHFVNSKDIHLSPCPIFEPSFYFSSQPDVLAANVRAFDHYLRFGDREGRNPHPAFDVTYLWAQTTDRGFGLSALHSFVEDERQDLSPHPLFDAQWYAGQLDCDSLGGLKPWIHCVTTDGHRRFSPHPLISPNYYLRKNDDVASANASPFFHYLKHGAAERRDPHPWFDTQYYLDRYHHGGAAVANPLVAYLAHADLNTISPHPLFAPDWYSYQHQELTGPYAGLLHFIVQGDREGRSPHPMFDQHFYCGGDRAIREKGGAAHFLESGYLEDRSPHPMFDMRHYRALNRGTLPAGANPLVHYLKADGVHRRHPHPLFDGTAHASSSALCHDTSIDPLLDYIQFRSNLDPTLIRQRRTSIPLPCKAILPERRASVAGAEPYLISVLLPVYNSPEKYLTRCVESIMTQRYSNWELIIVDDGSSTADFGDFLTALAATDPRIRLKFADSNGGISRATNLALEMARGDYVAMVDHDDVLLPDALTRVVMELESSGADACYTDQAYVTAWDTFDGDFHKPAWSPALMSGVMYVGHLLVVRTELACDLGGFDPGFDRVQDFEFMLRFGEKSSKIVNVPEILYHWRRIPGSIAHDGSAKGRIEELQASAVNAHFKRIGFRGKAEPHANLAHRLRIVPRAKQVYPDYDLIILDDGRDLRELRAAIGAAASSVAIIDVLNNASAQIADIQAAISRSAAPHILIVDAAAHWDVEERLSDALAIYCEQDDVLAAAPHLFDRQGRCVAAGSILDRELTIQPAMVGQMLGGDGYAGSLSCTREVSALHAAFVMIKRTHLTTLGGLDPRYMDLYFALADLQLRGRQNGLRNIAVAHPPVNFCSEDIVRHRSLTDVYILKDKHGSSIADGDPYYNPAFDPNGAYVRGA